METPMNSVYTTRLCNLEASEIFDFDFTLYGADSAEQTAHKTMFLDRFYKYYYFKEINGDSVYAFNRRLEETMAEWLDRFNVLYQQQSTLLANRDLISKKRSTKTTNSGTITDEFDTITNEHTGKFLDTPQVPYNAQNTDQYATSINTDTNDVNTTTERELDTEQDVDVLEEDSTLVESLDIAYKKYHDLDMDLIRKFKDCFLKIY